MSIIPTFLSFLTPHLFRITIDLLILALVVMCFCSALYLVTEIRVPESTFEQCKKLNEIAHLEWVFNLTLGFSFVVCRYFFCGFLTFPIGMWHLFKYLNEVMKSFILLRFIGKMFGINTLLFIRQN
jgi:hypothetical protein